MTNQYTPRSQQRPLPARGQPSSSEIRATNDQVITDIKGIASVANTNATDIIELKQLLFNELRALKSGITAFYNFTDSNNINNAESSNGLPFAYINSFSNTNDAYAHAGTPPEHLATINNDFNQLVLPKNNALSLFYEIPNDRPGEIVSKSPEVSVEGTLEYDGIVSPGTPDNAFNGNNTSHYVRKVSFPYHHDVTKVEMEITINVPAGTDANVLQLLPTPFGSITVKDIQYTSDLGEGWLSLGNLTNLYGYDDEQGVRHFTPQRNMYPIQIFIPPTTIRRLKITVEQDNWIEENGRKVFYYGFQEVGLLFIEWENTKDITDPFNVSKNNNLLFKVSAPAGYKFTDLAYFNSNPYDTSSDPALLWQVGIQKYDFSSSNIIWQSNNGALPQNMTVPPPISGSISNVYVKCILNMATSESPYMIGTPAFVNQLTMNLNIAADI